uniref:Cell envelope-related transcriptional attenuator domain-containing protein n=1 Tax=Thermosporothrix sp. COM3 TaxID=2490863 RepID=A0A455SR35_9CHLR|nr:hypothetical protein KTC_42400 [Thermosporothrix sp. COM3]
MKRQFKPIQPGLKDKASSSPQVSQAGTTPTIPPEQAQSQAAHPASLSGISGAGPISQWGQQFQAPGKQPLFTRPLTGNLDQNNTTQQQHPSTLPGIGPSWGGAFSPDQSAIQKKTLSQQLPGGSATSLSGIPQGNRPVTGPFAQHSHPAVKNPVSQANHSFAAPFVSPTKSGQLQQTPGPVTLPPVGNVKISGNLVSPAGEPPSTKPPTGKNKKGKRLPMWARILIAVLAVLVILGGSAFAYYQINFASSIGNILGQQADRKNKNDKVDHNVDPNNILSGKRLNILLLGSDNDDKFKVDLLTQSVIIVTIDPQTKYVGMLSIPRDLMVRMPDGTTEKMMRVFSAGYTPKFAETKSKDKALAAGAGITMDTIENQFGIPIDYYAWVGLDGFIKVIDTAGGVDVDVIHPMVDDTYPDDVHSSDHSGYRRLYIAPGPQHLNGVEALQYVRTRHADLIGDFGRSQRQQQVLNQLKTKLATIDTIGKLPELMKDMEGYVKTDLSLNQLIQLGNFGREVDMNKVDRMVFSPPYSQKLDEKSEDYYPVCTQMQPVLEKMFGTGTCNQTGNTSTPNQIASQAQQPSAVTASSPQQKPLLLNDEITGAQNIVKLMLMGVTGSFSVWS